MRSTDRVVDYHPWIAFPLVLEHVPFAILGVALASKAVRAHGPLVLWRGWMLQYMRVLPYGVLQFAFMEQIANLMGSSMT